MPRQAHCEQHFAEGGRGAVHRTRDVAQEARRGGGGDGFRRAGSGGDEGREDPHLQAQLRHLGEQGEVPSRRHHLRSERVDDRHGHGGALELRCGLHRGDESDQGAVPVREDQRRHLELVVWLPWREQDS